MRRGNKLVERHRCGGEYARHRLRNETERVTCLERAQNPIPVFVPRQFGIELAYGERDLPLDHQGAAKPEGAFPMQRLLPRLRLKRFRPEQCFTGTNKMKRTGAKTRI